MDSKTQIEALVTPWIQACLDRDWDGLLALCTDDVVFAPPGEPSISGEESLKTWLDAFPVMTAFEFSFDQIDESGDLAVAVGKGSWTIEMDDETASMTMKFADVFRRQADGAWLYSHAIWNHNES